MYTPGDDTCFPHFRLAPQRHLFRWNTALSQQKYSFVDYHSISRTTKVTWTLRGLMAQQPPFVSWGFEARLLVLCLWKWRECLRTRIPTSLHGTKTQKNIKILAAVKTSDLTSQGKLSNTGLEKPHIKNLILLHFPVLLERSRSVWGGREIWYDWRRRDIKTQNCKIKTWMEANLGCFRCRLLDKFNMDLKWGVTNKQVTSQPNQQSNNKATTNYPKKQRNYRTETVK